MAKRGFQTGGTGPTGVPKISDARPVFRSGRESLWLWLRPLALAGFLVLLVMTAWGAQAAGPLPENVFATVDGEEISAREYLTVLRMEARDTFYHREVPESEEIAFRKKVGESLILRVLLAGEAKRLGLKADEETVGRQLKALEARYSAMPKWKEQRESILSRVGGRLRDDSRVKALEERVKDIPRPEGTQVREYYRLHTDKFTTPERLALSAILLRVIAGSPAEDWEQARTRAEEIRNRVLKGEAFEDMAQLHSQDASADNGGDLGFLHRTQLGESVLKAVDGLEKGELSEPVLMLEGYGLFRLNGRRLAQLNPFKKVKDRAEGLWLREARERAWEEFRARLRETAHVELNEVYFHPETVATRNGPTGVRSAE